MSCHQNDLPLILLGRKLQRELRNVNDRFYKSFSIPMFERMKGKNKWGFTFWIPSFTVKGHALHSLSQMASLSTVSFSFNAFALHPLTFFLQCHTIFLFKKIPRKFFILISKKRSFGTNRFLGRQNLVHLSSNKKKARAGGLKKKKLTGMVKS